MSHFFMPIDKDGWIFIAIFAGISFLLGFVADGLGYAGAILTGWCVYFFRDPPRQVPQRDGLLVSPADGTVTAISKVQAPAELDLGTGEFTRVSIFLSVFNVHVNRVPVGGEVIKSIYHPGKFFNATLDKASEHNERQSLVVKTQEGHKIGFTQIAGLIARRIRCDVREGDKVLTGQKFGLIRFGSRMDVYLPKGIAPLVTIGQTTIGGETIVADFKTKDEPMQGEWL